MLRVIQIVATLTQGAQILGIAILGCVIEVSNRKDYPHLLARLWIEPHGVVLDSAELTSVVGAFKDSGAYLLPIFRIAVTVFGSYRHG